MLRVCFVTPRARAIDGWGRYAVELCLAMRERGIEPVLATCESDVDPDLGGVERHAILPPLVSRRFEAPRNLLAAPRLHRILSTCDVVHGIAEPYMPLIALARSGRQPYVQTAHGTWAVRPFTSIAARFIHRPALGGVDLLVFQSAYTRDAMTKVARLPHHVVLPGGVRGARFTEQAAVSPAIRGPLVLSVGSVKFRKGLHVALEAVALARRRFPGLQFVVAGRVDRTSSYAARLRDRAAVLGMSDSFHLLGEVTAAQLAGWYRAADVFVLLPVNDNGSFEGLGLVYLEAGAAGLPSIGTTGSGTADAVVDGTTGYLVPQDDPEAAARALESLMQNDDMRMRMGAAARERASGLSWDRLADELCVRYRQLLDARTSAS